MDANEEAWNNFLHDHSGQVFPPDLPGDEELAGQPMYLMKKIIITRVLRPDRLLKTCQQFINDVMSP